MSAGFPMRFSYIWNRTGKFLSYAGSLYDETCRSQQNIDCITLHDTFTCIKMLMFCDLSCSDYLSVIASRSIITVILFLGRLVNAISQEKPWGDFFRCLQRPLGLKDALIRLTSHHDLTQWPHTMTSLNDLCKNSLYVKTACFSLATVTLQAKHI